MSEIGSISIRSLRIFIGVYESHSFSVVARRKGVSASLVSRSIHQLEDALGQQLFYRNTRSVIPTEAGRAFFDYAKNMTGQLEEARKEMLDLSLEPAGLVRLNAPVFFGQRHIAPWLPELAERYPRMQIELILNDDYIDPHREATDVIFRIGTLNDSSFHARIFGTQQYHAAASPDYLKKYGYPEQPSELTSHRCLVYRGFSGPNRWLFRKHGGEWVQYHVSPLMVSNNAESLLTAALGGMGIVLFPDWLVGDAMKEGKLIKLLPDYEAAQETEQGKIAAIYPNARRPPLNVRAVIDYYVEVYGSPLYWQYE